MIEFWLMILDRDGYVITGRAGWRAARDARDAETCEQSEDDRRLWGRLVISNGRIGR